MFPTKKNPIDDKSLFPHQVSSFSQTLIWAYKDTETNQKKEETENFILAYFPLQKNVSFWKNDFINKWKFFGESKVDKIIFDFFSPSKLIFLSKIQNYRFNQKRNRDKMWENNSHTKENSL
jgi:hypothetical protein